jgi:hypothetical protein
VDVALREAAQQSSLQLNAKAKESANFSHVADFGLTEYAEFT